MKYKLIVSDIDGVWTDGSFYYSKDGDVVRRFTTKDSFGVKLCQLMDMPVLILSTEENAMVRKRMEKLQVEHILLGVQNKVSGLQTFCELHNINLDEVAYLGDDMNDFPLIGRTGLFACPSDAYPLIRQSADTVLEVEGGNGAFRAFVEFLLEKEGKLSEAYGKYLDLCQEK